MGRKRHTPEQIITALREAEVGLARGKSVKLISPGAGHHRADVLPVEAGVRRDEGEPGTAPEGARARERAPEASSGGLDTGQADPGGSGQGKLLSPEGRRRCVVRVRQQLGASERRACRVLGQPRTTQRRARKVASDEGALRGDIVRLASRFGRYGYRRVTDMLRIKGVMDRLAKFAQRRPGPRPRRHMVRDGYHQLLALRSTKAGAETPATPGSGVGLSSSFPRSTKAGAETPATPRRMPRPGPGSTRSTKAGAETPATQAGIGSLLRDLFLDLAQLRRYGGHLFEVPLRKAVKLT